MRNSELRGESCLIVGYGREGRSVYSYLRANAPEMRIAIADRHGLPAQEASALGVRVYSGDSYLQEAHTYDTLIRSPGVSIRELGSHCGPSTWVTSATNIFFAECPGRIVGITGTKGKSTTAALTVQILQQGFHDVRLVGNIGVPMLDCLGGATHETWFVAELSSYQLEDLRRSPSVAILLAIAPEHLDYHGSFEAYRAAKLRLVSQQGPDDVIITNVNAPYLQSPTSSTAPKRVTFREAPDGDALVSVKDHRVMLRGEIPIVGVDEIPLLGPGNLQNALAAITCGAVLGVAPEKMREGVVTFRPLAHRLEFVAKLRGVSFYNDSLSTIPEALVHALQALGDNVETVIAGGYDRGVSMDAVGPALAASQVKNLILLPTTGEKIYQAAVQAAPERPYRRIDASTMEEAVQAAFDYTTPDRICVMSPAASSFSMFRDYQERGERFKEAVVRLGEPADKGSPGT